MDAALASETLRLCARDEFAVAGAVARVSTPQRRPVEAPAPDGRRRAMIAPKTFDAFRLRRPQGTGKMKQRLSLKNHYFLYKRSLSFQLLALGRPTANHRDLI